MNQEIIMEWYNLTECIMLFKRRMEIMSDDKRKIIQAEIDLLELKKDKLISQYNIVEK